MKCELLFKLKKFNMIKLYLNKIGLIEIKFK